MSARIADVDEFAARFVACEIPRHEWTHIAHLVIGAWHVQRYGPDEALARLRTGIRRLNESHGTPNTRTSGYHETITRAYVQLLAQFLDRCPGEMPLGERAARLIDSSIADRDMLLTFYSRDTLMSTTARAAWVEPDRGPLRIADLAGFVLEDGA